MKTPTMKITKMIATCLVAVVAFGGAFADKIPAGETVDGVYHPDWETLVEANEAKAEEDNINLQTVVPAGETWIAYQEDMQWINKIGYIRQPNKYFRFNVRGTLILEDTTTGFKGYLIDSQTTSGATYIKRGTSTLTLNQTEFNAGGTLIIEQGTLLWAGTEVLGKATGDDASRICNIEVRDGATLQTAFDGGTTGFGKRKITIAGNGYDNAGAMHCTYRTLTPCSNLVLVADAKVVDDGSTQYIGGTVDLGGHTLTVVRNPSMGAIPLKDMAFANPGMLLFETPASGSIDVAVSGTTVLQEGLTVAMANNTRLLFKEASATVDAAVVATNGLMTVTSDVQSDIVFNGVISGPGNVTFAGNGSVTLAQKNTWEGTTTVDGNSAYQLKLKYGTSVPDLNKLTVTSGSVVPMPGNDGSELRWTTDQLLTFSQNFQVTASNRTITYDTTDLTGSPALTFGSAKVAEYFPNLDVIWNASGTGTGSYTLTGPYTVDNPLDINITGGTIKLSGNEQINLDDVLVSGTSATQGGTLFLDGAKDVVFGEKAITVGAASASSVIGRMVVSNAVLRSTCTEQITADWGKAKGHLWVGSRANGILEIEDGGVVSNKVYSGGGGPGGMSGNASGAIYQHGGIFAPVNNNQSYVSTTLGLYGYGFYQMDGGIVRPWNPLGSSNGGWFALGGYSGATFIQNGGTVDVTGLSSLTLGANGGGYAEYIVRKGTTTVSQLTVGQADGQGHGILTVDGPEAEFITTGGMYLNRWIDYSHDKYTIVNMNRGGTLESTAFAPAWDNSLYNSAYPVIVNFNGGVLRTKSSWNEILAANANRYSKVAVYEKGLTIEVPECGPTTQYTPIAGAGEGGIQTIALDEPVAGMIAPNVTITGDGCGATAIAEFDTRTRTVTNILITSRGWGYTAANTTIKLMDGKSQKQTLAFTVGATVAGGLTKTGAGTLNLYNQNTWGQWTRVVGGTLKVIDEGAIPDGTALTVSNGATIDFNGVAEPTFSSIAGDGGTVANGSIKLSGVVTMSALKYLAGETTVIDGTIDLTGVTEIQLTDGDQLGKEGTPLYLFKATNLVLPANEIAFTGLPTGWALKFQNNGLKMSRPRGFCVIFY